MAKRLRSSTLKDISISIRKQGINISIAIVKYRLDEQGLYKLQPSKSLSYLILIDLIG